MPLSNEALDRFVSQGMSELADTFRLESLAAEFPERCSWVSQFALRHVFFGHFADEYVPFGFLRVRRAEAALDEWEMACTTASRGIKLPSVYFTTLRHLEQCIANLYQAFDAERRARERFQKEEGRAMLFKPADGSTLQRLHQIYAKSRHFDPDGLRPGELQRVWLTNDGIRIQECHVSYAELGKTLRILGGAAQEVGGAWPPPDSHEAAPSS